MDLTAIRRAIAKVLVDSHSDLRAYHALPAKPNLPAAVVYPDDDFITYHETMTPNALASVRFVVLLLVSKAQGDERAQDQLDRLLVSVPDAIEADSTIGGAVEASLVRAARNYGSVNVGESASYGSVELTLEVNVRRR